MALVRCYQFLLAIIVGLWLGGLTFYAGIVVPIGTEIIGGTEQGFITQRVSNWLNAIGVLAVLMLGASLLQRKPSWSIGVTWACIAVLQLALLILHSMLDAQLIFESRSVQDGDEFYGWHRIYLIITGAQWLCGVAHVWFKTGRSPDAFSIESQ
jgi:hypothetical protein